MRLADFEAEPEHQQPKAKKMLTFACAMIMDSPWFVSTSSPDEPCSCSMTTLSSDASCSCSRTTLPWKGSCLMIAQSMCPVSKTVPSALMARVLTVHLCGNIPDICLTFDRLAFPQERWHLMQAASLAPDAWQ
eukprot:6378038-Amphidinium_carterae.3